MEEEKKEIPKIEEEKKEVSKNQELEEFKVMVALEMRKYLHTQVALGTVSLCALFSLMFLYIYNLTKLGNIVLIFVALYIGFIMVMAQKKVVYLNQKYKLPKSNLFRFIQK